MGIMIAKRRPPPPPLKKNGFPTRLFFTGIVIWVNLVQFSDAPSCYSQSHVTIMHFRIPAAMDLDDTKMLAKNRFHSRHDNIVIVVRSRCLLRSCKSLLGTIYVKIVRKIDRV